MKTYSILFVFTFFIDFIVIYFSKKHMCRLSIPLVYILYMYITILIQSTVEFITVLWV